MPEQPGLGPRRPPDNSTPPLTFTEAIRLEEEALGTVDDPAQCRLDLALACSNLGMLQTAMGEGENAAASLGRPSPCKSSSFGDAPDDPQRLRDLALTLNLSGGWTPNVSRPSH